MTKFTQMQIVPIQKDWYVAKGYINHYYCLGYGTTHTEALISVIKDYQIIANLYL